MGINISLFRHIMEKRVTRVSTALPEKKRTYRRVILGAENHEVHLWRIVPDGWIYPHTHPGSDDIWYIIEGAGDYYLTAENTIRVGPGDMAVASPGEVHGIFNPGQKDIVILSVLAPLPVEIEEAPGFEYPV